MSATATLTDPRPVALIVEPGGIPAALKVGRRFVVWQYDQRETTWTKLPYNPRTATLASSNAPTTWGRFDEALAAYAAGGWDGIGVMLRPHQAYPDDLVGIDLDHVYDPERQAITDDAAADIVITLPSYTEISPSGTGIRIIARGTLPASARRGNVEIYTWGRFLTLTGHRLTGTPDTVERIPGALEEVWQRYLAPAVSGATNGVHRTPTSPPLTDDDVTAKATAASNGGKVRALLDGDVTAYGGDDSAADLALMSLLAFWTQDHAQLDRLMRSSELYREKWDSRRGDSTYGADTIARALHNLGETWKGSPPITDSVSPIRVIGEQAPAEFPVKTVEDAISGKPPEMLVGRWIPKGAFGALWGPEYVGKTFAALDISLSLCAGIPWLGIELPQAPALYVLGEGRLRERILAWQCGHPGADVGGFRYHDQGFHFAFADERQVVALLNYIEQSQPALVVFDSLAATIGGDENASVDMGRVISVCLEIQRVSSFATATLLIGHPGKDAAKGIRGHSSLAPALDVSIRVSGSTSRVNSHDVAPHTETGGTVRLHSRKNKDGALVPDLAASMRSGVESVYLIHDAIARALADGARKMLRDLADAGGTKALTRWGDATDLHRNRQSQLRTELLDSGHVEANTASGTVTITETGEGEL